MKVQSLATRAGTVGELLAFLWQRKLWWMIPLIVLLAIILLVVVIAQTSAVTGWMYPVAL